MYEKLNTYNFINVLAFALSWVLNSTVPRGPGEEDNYFWTNGLAELNRRYESILTPVDLTYLVAHVVLLLEGVFTVCQLLPRYRGSIMVQEGVKHWFSVSALTQFLWSVGMGSQIENVWFSLLGIGFMISMFVSITIILMAQARLTDSTQTPEEYWLLRFPFSIHFGWAFAVMVQSINGFVVQMGVSQTFQLVLGFISLVAFAGVGYKMLFINGPHPNYIVPCVLAWFCFGIGMTELGPEVNWVVDGTAGVVFDYLSGIIGVVLGVVTAVVFYRTEYASKNLNEELAEDADYALA